LRRSRRKLDHFHPALNFPERVGMNLTVLRYDHVGELSCAVFKDPQKAIQHASPSQGRRMGPTVSRAARRCDSVRHVGRVSGDHRSGLLAGRGIEHSQSALTATRDLLAVDEMIDLRDREPSPSI
jgi:hypothetical protein